MSENPVDPVVELPYTDKKPQGAPDFYLAINSTFRFLLAKLGREGWIRYLQEMGRGYFTAVNQRWRSGGLSAVASYWRAFFAAEPGAEVEVTEKADRVEITVMTCPAIRHLRSQGREIVGEYCQHCFYLGNARAEASGFAMRLEGGNGACRHTYFALASAVEPQVMNRILEAQ